MAEDHLRMPSDPAATHLFLINPAYYKPSALQGGALFLRDQRTTKLDQSASNNDVITSEVKNEGLMAAALVDLGAGAGLGVSHQQLFNSSETSFQSQDNGVAKKETAKIQHTAVKIFVELTSELRAGMAIRYLYKDVALLGDPGINQAQLTRYRTSMIGYGSGLAYLTPKGGLGCSYFPPLRGKAVVSGEEKIVVESGDITCDGFAQPIPKWTFGLTVKRWIHEIDDLATGTTAANNQTEISLYGLDPAQYVFPQQLIMLGADFEVNQTTVLRFAVGRQSDDFNFRDLVRYNRVAVNTGSAAEKMEYYRARVMLKFTNKAVELNGGIGTVLKQQHEFPSSMNSATYESNGQELFATVGMKL